MSPLAFHADLLTLAEWGQWIYEHSSQEFYANRVWIYAWPTQTPLFNLILKFNYYLYFDKLTWLFSYVSAVLQNHNILPGFELWSRNFVNWWGHSFYSDTPFTWGQLIAIKIPVILADLLIGLLVWRTVLKTHMARPLLWTAVYLFSPFSWYLSSVWGQYDQVSVLFLLLAFILAFSESSLSFLAMPFLAASVAVKPTTLIFVPLFVFILFIKKVKPIYIVAGLLSAAVVLFAPLVQFTHDNVLHFALNDLKRIVFDKSEMRLTTNSFNFWHIFVGNKALGQNAKFLLIPANIWGYLSVAILNVWAVKKLKIRSLENLFLAIFIVGFGSWLFLTNMLERYILGGIVAGFLLTIYRPQLLKYWLILSAIFLLNLYHGFWFPHLPFLQSVLKVNEGVLTRFLSLLNVILFFIFLRKATIRD
ncbi:MAG: hypothetical protein HYW33_01670 [Candidatus Blackburnbacteria bacterium]|nr:hypothetical protein [Candidatus Blackburnbacteria bacterium]